METLAVERRATCPRCFGQLEPKVEGEMGRRIEWKACRFCGADFFPWPEHQWTEPSSDPGVQETRKMAGAL